MIFKEMSKKMLGKIANKIINNEPLDENDIKNFKNSVDNICTPLIDFSNILTTQHLEIPEQDLFIKNIISIDISLRYDLEFNMCNEHLSVSYDNDIVYNPDFSFTNNFSNEGMYNLFDDNIRIGHFALLFHPALKKKILKENKNMKISFVDVDNEKNLLSYKADYFFNENNATDYIGVCLDTSCTSKI